MLARALSELRQSGKYDYVVLQATKIAIPFYERNGFVRVGCVTRFNDNEALPEVAYRHWSEIVNGEAVEPSYMMARRLFGADKNGPGCWTRRTRTRITKKERELEIKSALKSAYSLLSDAMLIRAGTSNVYINSYREILSAAKEFAVSAEDVELAKVIERAVSEITGSAIGSSKSIIRQELKLPKNVKMKSTKSSGKDCSNTDQLLDANVNVICRSTKMKPLVASLSRSFLSTSSFSEVRVSLSGPQYRCKEPLFANIRVAASNCKADFVDAMTMAICNLKSYFCNVPSRQDTRRKSEQIVKKGQSIMLRVDGFGGLPVWVPAEVEKFCRQTSSESGNICITRWENESTGGIKRQRRLLDITNRGVGRDWCTDLDWSSFAMLPIKVLDVLIIGSWIQYQDPGGKNIKGNLVKRIGGGLNGNPKYRLSTWRKARKNRCPDLSALELREVVTINDESISRASVILNELTLETVSPFQNSEATQKSPGGNVMNKEASGLHASEAWASYRFLKFDLDRDKVHSFKEEIEGCEKIDDNIIHLSTGVGLSTKKLISNEKKRLDAQPTTNTNVPLQISSPEHCSKEKYQTAKKSECQSDDSIIQNSPCKPTRKRLPRRKSRSCNYAEPKSSSESDHSRMNKRNVRKKNSMRSKQKLISTCDSTSDIKQMELSIAIDDGKRSHMFRQRKGRSRSCYPEEKQLSASECYSPRRSNRKRKRNTNGSTHLQPFSSNGQSKQSKEEKANESERTYTKTRPRRSPRNSTNDDLPIAKRRKTRNL